MKFLRKAAFPFMLFGARRCLSASTTLREGMWPTGFMDPILHKKGLPAAKEDGEFDVKIQNPIKAVASDANCSLFYDDKVAKFHRLCWKYAEREPAENQLIRVYRNVKAAQLAKYWKAAPERRHLVVVDPKQIILTAIENARPLMMLENVKVGALTYTVPAPITMKRSEFEGMRWIVHAARDRDKAKWRFYQKLTEVLLETAACQGRVIQKKEEHHKTCEVNRAYSHYRRSR